MAWAPLKTLTDGTLGLTRSGTVTFDPSANPGWVTSTIGNNPARLFYIRVRTVRDGTPPIASTILGRDYVNARGGQSGVGVQ